MNNKSAPLSFEDVIKNSIKNSIGTKLSSQKSVKQPESKPKTVTNKTLLKEATVLIPKTFLLKTEFLSGKTKEAHLELYRKYVETFNKVSIQLDSVNRDEANPNSSAFRALKMSEVHNRNGVLLHEMYFDNISDQTSEISMDSLPFMRLSRDFGSFDNWQYDFRACCVANRDGWAICFYDAFKKRYINCILEGNCEHIPVGAIPVIVVDLHEHAYYKDYLTDTKAYSNAMLKELNWNIVESRMKVAEDSCIHVLYSIRPEINEIPDELMNKSKLSTNMLPVATQRNVPEEPNDQDVSTEPKV